MTYKKGTVVDDKLLSKSKSIIERYILIFDLESFDKFYSSIRDVSICNY